MPPPEIACFRVFHSGSFERVPHFSYIESEQFDVYMKPDYMIVDDIRRE